MNRTITVEKIPEDFGMTNEVPITNIFSKKP